MSPMDTILIESTYFENYKSKGYDDFITALKFFLSLRLPT